jgi:O-acetyl-ADP-ribose deacetylase (regulator of RNase III)
MICEGHGNLLDADVDALVNAVNTVGVMGKGIALQFKQVYPDMFKVYERAAKNGDVQLGKMHVYPTNALSGPRYIINFPTKQHWQDRSYLGDIRNGLTDLLQVVKSLGIESVAIPPLGCGNGGLDWRDVEPLIASIFEQLPNVRAVVYPPLAASAARGNSNHSDHDLLQDDPADRRVQTCHVRATVPAAWT